MTNPFSLSSPLGPSILGHCTIVSSDSSSFRTGTALRFFPFVFRSEPYVFRLLFLPIPTLDSYLSPYWFYSSEANHYWSIMYSHSDSLSVSLRFLLRTLPLR